MFAHREDAKSCSASASLCMTADLHIGCTLKNRVRGGGGVHILKILGSAGRPWDPLPCGACPSHSVRRSHHVDGMTLNVRPYFPTRRLFLLKASTPNPKPPLLHPLSHVLMNQTKPALAELLLHLVVFRTLGAASINTSISSYINPQQKLQA